MPKVLVQNYKVDELKLLNDWNKGKKKRNQTSVKMGSDFNQLYFD